MEYSGNEGKEMPGKGSMGRGEKIREEKGLKSRVGKACYRKGIQ